MYGGDVRIQVILGSRAGHFDLEIAPIFLSLKVSVYTICIFQVN